MSKLIYDSMGPGMILAHAIQHTKITIEQKSMPATSQPSCHKTLNTYFQFSLDNSLSPFCTKLRNQIVILEHMPLIAMAEESLRETLPARASEMLGNVEMWATRWCRCSLAADPLVGPRLCHHLTLPCSLQPECSAVVHFHSREAPFIRSDQPSVTTQLTSWGCQPEVGEALGSGDLCHSVSLH